MRCLGFERLDQRVLLSGVAFFDGKPLRYVRGRSFRDRQALQKKRKTGLVRRSKGKESRWAAGMNHEISRRIVVTAISQVPRRKPSH